MASSSFLDSFNAAKMHYDALAAENNRLMAALAERDQQIENLNKRLSAVLDQLILGRPLSLPEPAPRTTDEREDPLQNQVRQRDEPQPLPLLPALSLEELPRIGRAATWAALKRFTHDEIVVASSKVKRQNGFAEPYAHEIAREIRIVNTTLPDGTHLLGFRFNNKVYMNMNQLILATGLDSRLLGTDHMFVQRTNAAGASGWMNLRDAAALSA